MYPYGLPYLREINRLFMTLRMLIFGTLLALASTAQAQEVAGSVRQLLATYETALQRIGDPALSPRDVGQAKKELLDLLVSNQISVWNDLDTTDEAALVSVFQYVQQEMPARFPAGVQTTLAHEQLRLGRPTYDSVRACAVLEVRVPKQLRWFALVPPELADADTAPPPVAMDTVWHSHEVPLSVFVQYQPDQPNTARIAAISAAGQPPKWLPLPPLVAWWHEELDDTWRKMLMDKYRQQRYPDNYNLNNLVNQREMSLRGLATADFAPLAKFGNLRKLDLQGTLIADLEPLARLMQLEELDISQTKVQHLTGLENLQRLVVLRAQGLGLTDLTPIAKATRLIELNITSNAVEDLSPLANLKALQDLQLAHNQVVDLSPIGEMPVLQKLVIGRNKVKSLAPLSKLPELVYLDIFSTDITDLEAVRPLQKLIHLNAGGNPITSLEPVAHLRYLIHLNVSETRIKDLGAVKNFAYLEALDCSNTGIAELGPVHNLDRIRELKIFYTKITVKDKDRFKKRHPDCRITYY